LWNYAHFAVPIFIFCSAYLSFKTKKGTMSIIQILKRLQRLLIPYYLFLASWFSYIAITKKGAITLKGVLDKVFFLNAKSADLEWLVVLFIYFIFLFPFIYYLSKKPIVFWIYTIFALLSSVLLLFIHTSVPYRFLMWLPWSLLLSAILLVVKYEKNRLCIPVVIGISLVLFFLSRSIIVAQNHSLTLTHNKYPPNLYYLSYGMFWTFLIYMIYNKIRFPNLIDRFFFFYSAHSYSIFFIHFLIIFIFLDFFPFRILQWWGFFLIVLVLAPLVQLVLNKTMKCVIASRH